jgi:hypothetical protein
MEAVPEVYVLWHPRCALGEPAARAIYDWLRPGNGLGPQVFYRSLPAPEAPPGGLPRPLPLEPPPRDTAPRHSSTANLQIIVPLIDEQMIADPTWRYWLGSLGQRPIAQRIVPVALDTTAFNAPPPIREQNFLRPSGDDDARRIRALLKQLTEALCKLLLGDEVGTKIKIFLSHAKADGTGPARRIRDYIYGNTQIAAFYDENDIPFGSAFAKVLDHDIQSRQTVALIAVRSAAYARRPWCRRELSLFRRPTRVGANANLWRQNPVLVVDAIEGVKETPGIPELGNAPILRWTADAPDHEERIVTMVLRDALLAELHMALARHRPSDRSNAVINWLPDPISVLPIVRGSRKHLTIHHPGRSLPGLELDILEQVLPGVEFRSFEGV